MLGRLLFFVSLLAVSVLPDNLADLAKLGEKPDDDKKPRNRVRGRGGRSSRRGLRNPGDERELVPPIPAIQPNGDDNDAVRENRSGGPAGGGGGESHSAGQGDPDGLMADPAIIPSPDNPAS